MNIQHAASFHNLQLSPLSIGLAQISPDVDPQVGDASATDEPALPDGRQTLRKKLSDRHELHNLAKALDRALEELPEDATPEAVTAYFLATHLTLASSNASPRTASLESLIKAASPYYPKTRAELQELAQHLCEHLQKHPLGNLSGALGWTLPLSVEHQRTAYNVVASNSANLPGLPPPKPGAGALDYLANAVNLSAQLMQDPAAALEKLLDSPQAQALGAAVQASVGGIATGSSANDYVLATIHLSLDPEALDQKSNRNTVAGFDLGVEIHRDSSPDSVVEALANHLSSTDRTSPATAALAARLLLMRVAPQFLIKDIPASVRCHSQAWANLCIAVAGIEAHTPGRTMNMSFAEVMCADPSQYPASEAAKKNALIDWCVANDVIYRLDDAHYTPEDLEYARTAFNAQHEALKEASALLDKPLPNRERMAQERIKQHLGDDFPLDDKLFCLNYHKMGLRGQRFGPLYSLRELTMQGLKINTADWVIRNNSKGIDLQAVALFTRSPHFNVPQEFDKQFAQVTAHCKKIHHYTWMNAITQLPVADREILNNAKLSFYQEKSYRASPIPFWPNKLFHTSPKVLMQAELEDVKHVYEFDPVTATIKKVPSGRIAADEYISNEVIKVEALPLSQNLSTLGIENTRDAPPVNTFKNPRIRDIAQMIVNAQGIDSDAVRRQAEGRTSAERNRDTLNAIGEFILDLIPLRTAIVNWRNGNYKDAAADLAFDVFGFLTAGVGTASKLLKGARKVDTAISKLARATRIIGADTLSAFNPLGGLGDAAVGAGKLALAGAGAASDGIQRLRGMARGSDLIEAGAAFDDVAIGVFQRGDKSLEASAVLHEGKWYAVDAGTREPYGPPLEGFVPTHTYMPASYSPHPNAHRFDPIGRHARTRISSKITRKELPKGSYVESMKGKLEPGHFLRGNGKDETLKKFIEEMYETYDAIKNGALPPRIVPPQVSKTAPAAEVITEALKVSNGIVFGESHKEMASFKLLFDNVEKFKQEGVKTIYFEGVIDLPPKGIVDDGIGNLANPNLPRTQPTFAELKAKFELNGIEVLPLDHYYLTRHKDAKLGRTETGFGSRQRLEEFNYYASEVIQANSGTQKWLALVGHSHMNTTEGVPGLAEMTGSISIGVFDKPSPNVQNPLSPTALPGDLVIQV